MILLYRYNNIIDIIFNIIVSMILLMKSNIVSMILLLLSFVFNLSIYKMRLIPTKIKIKNSFPLYTYILFRPKN